MKKILVLGVGNAQADFIEFCKMHGYIVFSCSYRNEGRGKHYSDYFETINITDVEKIKDYMKRKDIDIIYSVGSDIAMRSVSEVSQDLHSFHFVTAETARICNHKSMLRDTLAQINQGKYTVKHSYIPNNESSISWNVYPAVVKPVDSQGQRGISLVHNPKELRSAVNIAISNSPSHAAIVEEYIDGFEISVNVYMVEGNIKLFFITERISFEEYPGGIIKSHLYPVSKLIDEKELRMLVEKTASHLNIRNGPIYYQIKINSAGEPFIIEITPRLDGCHLWRLIKILKGPDLFQILLQHLSGNAMPDNSFYTKDNHINGRASLSFFTQAPETKMCKELFHVDPRAFYVEWYYDNGEVIRPINGYQEKVGYQIKVE